MSAVLSDDEIEFDDRLKSLQHELRVAGNNIINYVTSLHSSINIKKNASSSSPTTATTAAFTTTAPTSTTPTTKINLKENPRTAIRILQHDISEMLEMISKKEAIAMKHLDEINTCSSSIDVLHKVCITIETIGKCNDIVNQSSDLIKACSVIDEMNAHMKELLNTVYGTGQVCLLLQRESTLIRSRFASRLKRLLSTCIQFDVGRVSVTKRLEGMLKIDDILLESPIELCDVWMSLKHTGQLRECLEQVLMSMWSSIVIPLWKERKSQQPNIVLDNDRSEMSFDSIAKNSYTTDDGSHHPGAFIGCSKIPFPKLLEHITQSMQFLSKEILNLLPDVLTVASTILQASPIQFMDTIYNTLLAFIPKVESDLAAFHKLCDRSCSEFEVKIKSFGFDVFEISVPVWSTSLDRLKSTSTATDSSRDDVDDKYDQQPLSKVMSNLVGYYIEAKRNEVLGQARKLILSDYHNTMIALGDATDDETTSAGDVGDNKAMNDKSGSFAMQSLRFEQCQVSLTSCRLLKLTHEVMKSAVSSSSSYSSNILYQTARDCIQLYMAIVHMHFADVIETVPRMGAVFYNDCTYIAHNCIIITHTYKNDMSKKHESMADSIGFVDFISRLRLLGEQKLMKHVEDQRTSLLELLSRVEISTSSSSSTSVAYNDIQSAELILKHLDRLHSQWYNVLQESLYDKVMGYLIHEVLKAAMHPVLSSDDIGEDVCRDISRIYHILQRSKYLFPHLKKKEDGSTRFTTSSTNTSTYNMIVDDNSSNNESLLCKHIAIWKKFCALTDLLEYNQTEIAEWLPRKKFSSFTATELVRLVEALFIDSAKRKSLLLAILDIGN